MNFKAGLPRSMVEFKANFREVHLLKGVDLESEPMERCLRQNVII